MNKRSIRSFSPNLKYTHEYAGRAYELLSDQKTDVEVRAALDISPATWYAWLDKYEEFRLAVELGEQAGLSKFHEEERTHRFNPNFNAVTHNNYLSRVYGVGKQKKKRIDLRAKSFKESYDKLLALAANAQLDNKELQELTKVLIDGMTLCQKDVSPDTETLEDMRKRIDELLKKHKREY